MSRFDEYERIVCFNNDRISIVKNKDIIKVTNISNHSVSWLRGTILASMRQQMDYIYKGDTLYTDGNEIYTKTGKRFEFLVFESTIHERDVNVYEQHNLYVKVLDTEGNAYANLMILYKNADLDVYKGQKELAISKFDTWYWASKQKPLPIFGCDRSAETGHFTGQYAGINLDTGESIFISEESLSKFRCIESRDYKEYYKWFDNFYLSHRETLFDEDLVNWCRWNRLLMLPEGATLSAVERKTNDEYFINLAEWPLDLKNEDFVPAYNFGLKSVDMHFGFNGSPCMLQIVSTNLNDLGMILKDKHGNIYIAFSKDARIKPGSYKLKGII